MKFPIILSLTAVALISLSGCANQARLGEHMNSIRLAQIYNPDATEENLTVIPVGIGERMEKAYKLYTGETEKKSSKSKNSVNLILGGE